MVRPNLTHIIFGWFFNQSIDNLPNSLIHITFGNNFNQPFNNSLISLTHIIFGDDFNQLLPLLPSLTHITFGKNFDQSIDNLSKTVRYINISKKYVIPKFITRIVLFKKIE